MRANGQGRMPIARQGEVGILGDGDHWGQDGTCIESGKIPSVETDEA